MKTMKRHLDTNEVFILVKVSGMLLLAGNVDKPVNIQSFQMNIGEEYNVKKNTWHSIALSEEAHVIIVEKSNTNISNSGLLALEGDDRLYTRDIVIEFLYKRFKKEKV